MNPLPPKGFDTRQLRLLTVSGDAFIEQYFSIHWGLAMDQAGSVIQRNQLALA
jgi:hypothetical protein